jgi:hypothetical protein
MECANKSETNVFGYCVSHLEGYGIAMGVLEAQDLGDLVLERPYLLFSAAQMYPLPSAFDILLKPSSGGSSSTDMAASREGGGVVVEVGNQSKECQARRGQQLGKLCKTAFG